MDSVASLVRIYLKLDSYYVKTRKKGVLDNVVPGIWETKCKSSHKRHLITRDIDQNLN